MKILAIVPAYNEAANIEKTVANLKSCGSSVDYVVINDCSTDNTLDILKANDFNYISLPVNLGIGGGVQTGYKYGVENGYDIIIQQDGDGQHDPKYIKDVCAPIINGDADIVVGSRFITNEGFQSSGTRRIGIGFLSWLIKLKCGTVVKDVTSGYRAVNNKYSLFFARNYPQDYPEPEAIVSASLAGARIKEVPVVMKEREYGKSSINLKRSIYYMIKVSLAILLCKKESDI
ncbi:MAG: glycosyltransferase family 2 protein [Clostridiales bacterium]|nr:glycosyltransferase family 2 protein [Clostridiales bacterium]